MKVGACDKEDGSERGNVATAGKKSEDSNITINSSTVEVRGRSTYYCAYQMGESQRSELNLRSSSTAIGHLCRR